MFRIWYLWLIELKICQAMHTASFTPSSRSPCSWPNPTQTSTIFILHILPPYIAFEKALNPSPALKTQQRSTAQVGPMWKAGVQQNLHRKVAWQWSLISLWPVSPVSTGVEDVTVGLSSVKYLYVPTDSSISNFLNIFWNVFFNF